MFSHLHKNRQVCEKETLDLPEFGVMFINSIAAKSH